MTSDPISCEQSLLALASAPASELVGESPVARHVSSCPQCSRVAQVVLERERSLGYALDSLESRADPMVISDTAMLARERHGRGRFVRWLLLGLLAGTTWFALDDTLGTREREVAATMRVETIEFSCLTPAQAEGLIEPYVRSNRHGIYTPPEGIRGITLRATPAEIAQSRGLISKFDSQMRVEGGTSCKAPAPAPALPTPKP